LWTNIAQRFHFRTRRQELNSVEGGTRANLNYLDQLSKYHKQHGTSLNRFPSVDKRPLDLYRLKKAVEIRGGFHNVCKHKKWAEIGRDLGYSGKIMSSLSTSLKNSYSRYLQPYEEWVRNAKPAVQQQIEAEFGGPITPSPHNSPAAKRQTEKPANSPLGCFGPDSPAVRAASALNNAVSAVGTPERSDTEMADATPLISTASSVNGGFTAVNTGAGGFTPVNMSVSSFPSINGTKREAESGLTSAARSENGLSSKRSSPDGGSGSPLKRLHSGLDGGGDANSDLAKDANSKSDEDGSGERRSKRLRKGWWLWLGVLRLGI
jgi:histone demethylase JARID1